MDEATTSRPRRRRGWTAGILVIVGALIAVPVTGVAWRHPGLTSSAQWASSRRSRPGTGARHGCSAPVLEGFDLWSEEDHIRNLGGATPETQVIVSERAEGPAGQWLAFTFQDLSKDTTGRFKERLAPAAGTGWQLSTLSISYGANGLLHEAAREEFKSGLAPFTGLTPPPPLET
jgi:hypothetical protein